MLNLDNFRTLSKYRENDTSAGYGDALKECFGEACKAIFAELSFSAGHLIINYQPEESDDRLTYTTENAAQESRACFLFKEYQGYINGTNPNRTYVTSKGDTLTRTTTNGMLDVPKGIELNMATPIADCHLTGYYCDYGQGLAGVYGDYETPSKGVNDAGGISFLSHVGEYVYTEKDSENTVIYTDEE